MAEKKTLKATHNGTLKIGDIGLKVAVLEDGTRVIARAAVFKAFGRPQRGPRKGDQRAVDVPAFIDAKNLQPFIHNDLLEVINPIHYMEGNTKKDGFKADILPLVCDVYLKAREAGALTAKQAPVAKGSEILVRSLSKVGIVALVDEATGYQEVRNKDELQNLLALYVRKEFLPWTKKFPDTFYEEMFRLKGWTYNPVGGKKSQLVGKITNELIYDKLPKGVLAELKRVTPVSKAGNRTKKLHQSLTDSIGNPHLEKQLASVTTLMKVSPSWSKFKRLFVRAFGGQEELEFPEKDED